MAEKYWNYELGLKGRIALLLVGNHVTQIAAEPDGEDSTGRQQMRLQNPEFMVARAFHIADEFVRRAEEAGEVRPEASLNLNFDRLVDKLKAIDVPEGTV